jgi:D-beta-D-heptose 7-phosphate kinase/D-beta-D-heptose 1-phosphate adenosyltransferase
MTFDISKFNDCKILVIGDLMIDEYVWGEVDRISPEAPVQVVAVTGEDYTLGGAGNVINNLVTLGANVWAIGVIGNDARGKLLLEKLKDLNVDANGVITELERPSTIKTRIIAAHQHVLRIDRETHKEIARQTFSKLAAAAEKIIPGAGAVLISDYGKGMITPEFLKEIIHCARKHKKPVIIDPKGFDYTMYRGASLVTPNKKEASQASGIEIEDTAALHRAGEKILENTGIERMLVTLGKDGMVLFEPDQKPFKIATRARQVFDVSGAGDTVVALLGLALAAGSTYKEAVALANTAAGLVVGKVGTATVSQKELKAALQPSFDPAVLKQIPLADLNSLAADLKKKGKIIVLTNGCFDLLHAGHIAFFTQAKAMGDVLIVAIDDDESVRQLKGTGRPVIRAKERIKIIGALDVVDYVVVFPTDQLKNLIKTLQPDVLTKGSNYQHETVYGHEIVEQYGGRVALIPISDDISSTDIINKIKGGKSEK